MNDALTRLRAICSGLPGTTETLTFGHPTFKVGKKSFAVLENYKGVDCLWLRIDRGEREALLKQRGWFKSPYDPREEALCWDLAAIAWDRAEILIRSSHRIART
jgi:predicted DNA-binding protein (MmcQ/YjbR family)